MNFLKRFLREEDGMETIEVVVIIAVLVTIALVFRNSITGFVGNLTENLFSENNKEDWTATDPNKVPK